jgi:HSP20 family protein
MANWIAPRHAVRRVVPTPIGSFQDLASLNRLFEDVWPRLETRPIARAAAFSPKVNVDESDGEARLTVELPGLADKDFEVTVDGDLLTIKGEKRLECEVENEGRSVSERSEGSFARSFRFAWAVDPDTVKAAYKNGVLQVVVPKPEENQPQVRSIPVTTSDR